MITIELTNEEAYLLMAAVHNRLAEIELYHERHPELPIQSDIQFHYESIEKRLAKAGVTV